MTTWTDQDSGPKPQGHCRPWTYVTSPSSATDSNRPRYHHFKGRQRREPESCEVHRVFFAAGVLSAVRLDLMFITTRGVGMEAKQVHVVPQVEIGTAPSSRTQYQPNSSAINKVVPPASQRNNVGLGVAVLASQFSCNSRAFVEEGVRSSPCLLSSVRVPIVGCIFCPHTLRVASESNLDHDACINRWLV